MSCIYLLGAEILLYSLIVAFPGNDHLEFFFCLIGFARVLFHKMPMDKSGIQEI